MQVVDPGHEYELDSYDGGEPVRLVFVKREGEGYPFNVGHHPGTNCQEVWRATIARIQYLQTQEQCDENITAITKLRELIWLFEMRAARRHGRPLANLPQAIETALTCKGCGHIGCKGQHHAHEIDTRISPASAAPVVDNAPPPCGMCDTGLVFTEQELAALTKLYERTGLRTAQIIKQALRVYQLHIHGEGHSLAAPTKDKSGWLLEKMHNGNVHYIAADYVLQWSDDPNKALRLARREDAEALCTIVEDCEKIAEHGWPAAATAAPVESEEE